MTTPASHSPRHGRVLWVLAGLIGAAIVVFTVLLAVRPPIVDDPRLIIPVDDSGEIHAAFVGGSLTTGVFASRPENGFRPLTVAGLGDGATESRAGVDSGSVLEALATLEIPEGTNLVVVEVGSGDVWSVPDDEMGASFELLVEEVRLQAPDAALICLGVWNDEQATSLYDDEVRRPCQRAGGLFLPLIDIYETPGMRSVAGVDSYGGPADGFHPGDDGYSAIAKLILSNVRVP